MAILESAPASAGSAYSELWRGLSCSCGAVHLAIVNSAWQGGGSLPLACVPPCPPPLAQRRDTSRNRPRTYTDAAAESALLHESLPLARVLPQNRVVRTASERVPPARTGSLRRRSRARRSRLGHSRFARAPQEVMEPFGQGGRVTRAHAGPDGSHRRRSVRRFGSFPLARAVLPIHPRAGRRHRVAPADSTT